MTVLNVYNNLMTRISDIKKYREAYRAKKTPLDTMEAGALTNILSELYAVAADLESTEEVNPAWGTRDKGTFNIGKQD